MRGLPLLSLVVLTSACVEASGEVTWIAPMDGRTGVALDAPLVLAAGTHGLPPDYAAAPMVRVVDLTHGGSVPGTTRLDFGTLVFVPEQPWRPDRRYVWTVADPGEVPHGPEVGLAPRLLGDAVFGTGASTRVLDAVRGPDDQTCFVLSQPLDSPAPVPARVTVNEVALAATALLPLPRDVWAVGLGGAVPVDVDAACLPPESQVLAGTLLRVTLDDERWAVRQRDVSVLEAVLVRHRAARGGSAP